MKVTQNLKLPQYTEDDVFDLTVINEAYNKIDTAYKEIDTTYKEIANLREEIPKVNANAEIIDARVGQATLGDKIRNIDSQLDNKIEEIQVNNKNNFLEINNKITDVSSQLDTITQQRLTTITPQMFGCVGDGVTDDTVNFQNCINYAIQNKSLITSDRNKTYKLSKELMINGVVNIDLQDSTLLATHSGSVITVNHKGVNTYNGQLKNIIIDCNYVAEKGINIVYSQRRYFQNISIKNVKQYGIYIGVLSGNVNKFSYCYIITDPTIASRCTGIYCDTFDQAFSHIDMVNMYICIDQGAGNAFYNEVHGYITHPNIMFEGSCFYKGRSWESVMLTNCYPDTQQYFYYISEVAKLNIVNNFAYNNVDILTEDFMQGRKGYVFYFANGNANYSRRVSVSDSSFSGLTHNGVSYYEFSNLKNNSLIKINSTTTFQDLIKHECCSRNALVNIKVPTSNVLKNVIKLGQETYMLQFEFKYNPSIQGALTPSLGYAIGDLPSSYMHLSDSDDFFNFPVDYGYYVDGVYKSKGYLMGQIKNNPLIRIFSNTDMYDEKKHICDGTNNFDYTIKINVLLPFYNY